MIEQIGKGDLDFRKGDQMSIARKERIDQSKICTQLATTATPKMPCLNRPIFITHSQTCAGFFQIWAKIGKK